MEVCSLDTTQEFNIDTIQDHLHNWRSILIVYRLWESLTWYNTRPVLIFLTRFSLILLTSCTIQHNHLNHMRILRTWYNTTSLLDTTQVLGNDSLCCTINIKSTGAWLWIEQEGQFEFILEKDDILGIWAFKTLVEKNLRSIQCIYQ